MPCFYFKEQGILFMKNYFLNISSILLILFTSCKQEQGDFVPINKDKMVEVLADMELLGASEVIKSNEQHINLNGLRLNVLEKHKVSKSDFDNSFLYYSKSPKQLEKIYGEVVTKLIGNLSE